MSSPNLRPVAFVLVSTNHGSMLVNRQDYCLVGEGQGYGVGWQLLTNSAYDPAEVDLVQQLLASRKNNFGDGVMAIDCGANIGVHTIEWAKFMHGWGEVLAFEAQERVFYALAGNITLNNCFNARAFWAAVGAENGSIGVPRPDYLTPSSFGSLEIRKTQSTEYIGQSIDYSKEKLQTVTLMKLDVLALPRLDFLKIDIEGMEMEAFLGARETIERTRPQILVEKIKSDESVLRTFLESRGYQVFAVGMNLLAVHHSDPIVGQISLA